MDAIAKYGFYNTEKNAFLCSDGHCWFRGIDLMKCKKRKAGGRIPLKYYLGSPFPFDLKCDADVYELLPSKEEREFASLPEDAKLYVAIGSVGKYGSLISTHSASIYNATKEQR